MAGTAAEFARFVSTGWDFGSLSSPGVRLWPVLHSVYRTTRDC